MNAKNPNLLSYVFMLTQQKLKSLNLETIRQLAIQFHLDPNQNLSFLISELSQIFFLQTVGSQSNVPNWGPVGQENLYMQNYNEALQKYMLLSNLEKNYYNLLMSNSMRPNGLMQGNLEEQKKLQSQMMLNGMLGPKAGSSSPTIGNAFDLPKTQDFSKEKSCICNGQISPFKEQFNKIIQCTNSQCNSTFHEKCINCSPAEDFECPKCVLSSIDPFNHVISQISDYFYIPNQNENFIYDLMIFLNQDHMKKIMENPNVGIEIRSVRLNSKEMFETTWIDYGEIFLNNNKIHELTPLNVSISLKKRKDEKIFTRDSLTLGVNFIKIVTKKITQQEKNQFKFCENAKHLMAVFLVEKQGWNQVRDNVPLLDLNACHQKVLKKFVLGNGSEKNDETAFKVDKINISMLDTLDLNLIETPARGANCDHLQCFSLENYLKMMEVSFPRKFQCPICKSRSYNLYIDSFFLKILKEAQASGKTFSEITFRKDGSYSLNESQQDKDSSCCEELKGDEAFRSEEFCWTNGKNDYTDLPTASTSKKSQDVIVIEEEEPMKEQPMVMPRFPMQQAQMMMPNMANNMMLSDIQMIKMKQLQMSLNQMPAQFQPQFGQQQNYPQMNGWNDSFAARNQIEMERIWQVMQTGTNGYYRK